MKTKLGCCLCLCLLVASPEKPAIAQEPITVGEGDCMKMADSAWPECTNYPQSCAFSQGDPQDVSPATELINGVWYEIPVYEYSCPETATGVMEKNGKPTSMCYTRGTSGSTTQVKSSYVCYRITACDRDAIPSNQNHDTHARMKLRWVPWPNGEEFWDGEWGYWKQAGLVYAKKSNCTGDANHPLDPFPSEGTQIALSCGPANCPQTP